MTDLFTFCRLRLASIRFLTIGGINVVGTLHFLLVQFIFLLLLQSLPHQDDKSESLDDSVVRFFIFSFRHVLHFLRSRSPQDDPSKGSEESVCHFCVPFEVLDYALRSRPMYCQYCNVFLLGFPSDRFSPSYRPLLLWIRMNHRWTRFPSFCFSCHVGVRVRQTCEMFYSLR